MINENSVLKLSKNILKRYENKLQGGIVFLFDVESKESWAGNKSTNTLINILDGQKTVKEVLDNFKQIYSTYDEDEIKRVTTQILTDLLERKFLTITKT